MGFVVKNTTKLSPLDLLCPHTCKGCGRLGAVFCECCKKYMFERQKVICPLCKREVAERAENVSKCKDCETDYEGIWVVGWREEALAKLVSEFKYQSVRACGEVLVELLDATIPEGVFVGRKVLVVPLPTIGRHVRERGLDHTWVLAKKLAKKRGWECERVLGRAVDTVQVGSKVADRQKQATKAYEVRAEIEKDTVYILLDDIWTTGSTMVSAGALMKKHGAKEMYAVVLGVGRDKQSEMEDEKQTSDLV